MLHSFNQIFDGNSINCAFTIVASAELRFSACWRKYHGAKSTSCNQIPVVVMDVSFAKGNVVFQYQDAFILNPGLELIKPVTVAEDQVLKLGV
jgi:hypothetical protein